MGRVKSDNRHLGILTGYEARWIHQAGGTATVTPRTGESVVLHRVVVNSTSASPVIIQDSAVGVIATLKANVSEGAYVYAIKLKGDLVVENPGNSDLTVTFSND